jgi:hypothetical protein
LNRDDGSTLTMKTGSIKCLALMGMVLTLCNYPSGAQVPEVKRPTKQLKLVPASQTNGSAAFACGDFRKTMSEVSKGLVTDGEFQKRIASVYYHARLATLDSVSPKPPENFGPSAEEMLRSIIEGNHQSFVSAADRFSKACKSLSF